MIDLRIGKALVMARAKWYELDNAAKIVPSTAKGADTRVFRITCELKEDVDGALLQQALDRTVPDFPHFASVLRKGLFWYYLDSSNIRAVVQPENKPPCSAIYFDGRIGADIIVFRNSSKYLSAHPSDAMQDIKPDRKGTQSSYSGTKIFLLRN